MKSPGKGPGPEPSKRIEAKPPVAETIVQTAASVSMDGSGPIAADPTASESLLTEFVPSERSPAGVRDYEEAPSSSDLDQNPSVEGGGVIRKALHEGEWWFSVIDVVGVLVGDERPSKYWNDLKRRLGEEGYAEISAKIGKLKMPGTDGKLYPTDCANTETLFRIIQSIPSPKVEPLKRWLAKIGKERIDEIENPELSMERMQEVYEQKGYPKEWIDKRLRGIAVRQDLTDEWKGREVKTSKEFAILTNEIMKGAFGLKVEDYKKVKGLSRENLRDHMTDIELILTMLGEATTVKIHRDRDSEGMVPLMKDARDGGAVAGRTRLDIEQQSGTPVISPENFLSLTARPKKKVKDNDGKE